jgi:twitching motility protein PilT
VLGTVHASSAPQTITRLLDLFPQESRELIRQSLGFNLKAVVCQRLLQSIAQGIQRIPAVEIMIMNPSVRQLLQEGRDAELADVIRAHEREGMQSFTSSLRTLIEKEMIDPKVAYDAAPNVDELKMLLKGISAGRAGLMR